MTRLPTIACAILTSGCSLLGLADVELPRCASSADCAALNAADGIADDACELWQCAPQTSRCVFGPRDYDADGQLAASCGGVDCDDREPTVFGGARERCDQLDNDCDAVVDEEVVTLDAVDTLATGVEAIDLAWSSSATPAAAWTTDQGRAVLLDIESGNRVPMSYARGLDDANLMRPELDPADRCPARSIDGVVPTGCDFREIALAEASAGGLFAAVIQQRGCVEGQLRIGRIDDRTSGRVVLRGPIARSNLYLGVEVATDRPCTGGSRVSGVRGAARVAIASHVQTRPQALVAWVADAVDQRPACGGSEVDVEVIGVFDERGRSGGLEVRWVTGTNDGAPQVIGRTRGGAPPALAAWPDVGTFVAFADPDGDVAIHFVPLAEPPDALAPNADPNRARPTAPLQIGPALATIDANGADAVQLAIAATDEQATLDVVFVDGCGRADARAQWTSLTLDRTPAVRARTDHPALVEGRIGGPVIASGGALVAVRRDEEYVLARRFDARAAPVEPDWTRAPGTTDGELGLFAHDGVPRIGYVDAARGALVATSFACTE